MTTIVDTDAARSDGVEEVGLRERKKQQTRKAIHEAAFRLIDEQGLEATTIDQICAAAEVSSRTFFNYFSSKAAAALELPENAISAETQARFRAARGSLVSAVCDLVGSNAEVGASHARMKQLIGHRPELITTLSQMMLEVRGQFVSLATERAADQEQAELAVTLVMVALSRVMHNEGRSDAPLAVRLRKSIDELSDVLGQNLQPASSGS